MVRYTIGPPKKRKTIIYTNPSRNPVARVMSRTSLAEIISEMYFWMFIPPKYLLNSALKAARPSYFSASLSGTQNVPNLLVPYLKAFPTSTPPR